jgi:glycerol-3-phosphate responsive antiterminator
MAKQVGRASSSALIFFRKEIVFCFLFFQKRVKKTTKKEEERREKDFVEALPGALIRNSVYTISFGRHTPVPAG